MDKRRETEADALAWQVGVWDRMAPVYIREIDVRFRQVVDRTVARAQLRPGQHVLDLGTGTGSVALRAALAVVPDGKVTAVDISPEMLTLARRRAAASGRSNIEFLEGRAERLPVASKSVDMLLACLSLMYVIDRAAAAREIARVLKPKAKLVSAVWAGPQHADIVMFQQIAGGFAPEPPVAGVGPGALADPAPFLSQLAEAGVKTRVETEIMEFSFDSFDSAWDVLAGVTVSRLEPDQAEEAKRAVHVAMWPARDGPRIFRNQTQFILGRRLE